MTSSVTTITVQRGDALILDVTIPGQDAPTITAAAHSFTVARRLDQAALITKTSGAGGGIVPATIAPATVVNGVAVSLAATDTTWLPWPAYSHLFYRLVMTPAGGGAITVAEGDLLLQP